MAGDASLWKCCNLDTSGGKRRWLSPDCRIEPFASCSVLPIRGPSVAPPNPPDGRSRTKAPAACWGFRLVIIPTRHRAASSTRQTLARPMPIALAILVAPEALGLHLARLDHQRCRGIAGMTSDSLWSFREADRQQAPHLNRPSAIVANPTQATDIHRSLSTFGGESVPPGGRDSHTNPSSPGGTPHQ